MSRHRSFLRDDRGVAAIEFGLIAPALMALALGLFEVTRLVGANMRVHGAAQAVADMAAQRETLNATQIANLCAGARMAMHPLPGLDLKIAIASVTRAGATASVDWNDTSCGSPPSISGAASLAPTLTPVAGSGVIVVRATFTYTSVVTYVLPSGFTITATAFARPRNVLTVAKV